MVVLIRSIATNIIIQVEIRVNNGNLTRNKSFLVNQSAANFENNDLHSEIYILTLFYVLIAEPKNL